MFILTIPLALLFSLWLWRQIDCSSYLNSPDVIYIRRPEKRQRKSAKRELKESERNIWV